jgi:hypothetical protein
MEILTPRAVSPATIQEYKMPRSEGSPVNIQSTDSAELVAEALGQKKPQPAADEKKSVETKAVSETVEEPNESHEGHESDDHDEKPKKKGGFQKRIDKLSQKAAQAERDRDYWREQALKSSKPQPEVKEPEKKADTSSKPKPDDFEKHEDYVEALTEWKADQKIEKKFADRDRQEKESRAKSEKEKLIKTHSDRLKEFKKSHVDFDEVFSEISDERVSPVLESAILESENGPELMYELARNPDEFRRINGLDAVSAARAIGRFEAAFQKGSSEETEAEPKKTKAPAPIKPVGSKASQPKTSKDDNLPYDEWRKVRDQEIASSKKPGRRLQFR